MAKERDHRFGSAGEFLEAVESKDVVYKKDVKETVVVSRPEIVPVEKGPGPYIPMFRGNPARTGAYSERGVTEFHGVKWRFETGDRVYSSPTVVDGVLYVGSRDNYLYAIE